ncbi:hypothetical protein ACHMWN_13225 [Pedobacter sp. UC225_61]|uniref:hypothetical protein n=1 Tax=Pedobacter sp. UC225_61 TaxID=3374623 RepID=UPI003796E9FE
MKFKMLFSFLVLFSINGFSQLSYDGTIDYIETKMNECDGLRWTYSTPSYYRFSKLEFGVRSDDKSKLIINLTRTYENGTVEDVQYIFDPTHIKGFGYYTHSGEQNPTELIDVQMNGNTAIIINRKNGTQTEKNDWHFYIPYLKLDPLNKERMRQAFLLLKKLAVAKKGSDPFAN